MKRLLIVLVLVTAGVTGLGFYRGWFSVASDNSGGTHNVSFKVDEAKIKKDKDTTLDQIHGLGHAGQEKAAAPTENGKDRAAPAPSPPPNGR